MAHLIYCRERGFEFEVEAESLSIDNITEALVDVFDGFIFDELEKEGESPCGFFPNPDEISSIFYRNIRKRLHQKFASIPVHGKPLAADAAITSTVLIDIDSVIDGLIEQRQGYEQSCIDAGEVIIRKLKNFLNAGIWQFGLRKEDGSVLSDARQWPEPITDGCSASWTRPKEKMSPIIWFGMQDNAPLECWSLTLDAKMFEQIDYDADSTKNKPIERWKSFWFCPFWSFDWDELFDHCGDTYIFWMFFESDMDEPCEELEKIRKSCPIKLASTDSRDELTRKITSFFTRKYSDALRHG
jgi:hypothetical protein